MATITLDLTELLRELKNFTNPSTFDVEKGHILSVLLPIIIGFIVLIFIMVLVIIWRYLHHTEEFEESENNEENLPEQ